MEYTKGDWYWEYINGKPHNLRAKTDERGSNSHILYVANDFLGENSLDNEANARLIAQAPKLYEACKQILADVDRTGYGKVPHLVNMQQVIAEVEGK